MRRPGLVSKPPQVLKREIVLSDQEPVLIAYRRSSFGGFFADAAIVGSVFATCEGAVECAPGVGQIRTPDAKNKHSAMMRILR